MSLSKTAKVIGVAVGLLVLSRLPFLLAHPDWGVFEPEHLWMLTDPAAAQFWGSFFGDEVGSLEFIDPGRYVSHYHAGALWVARGIQWLGAVTGDIGLLQLKLLGLLGSMLALAAYVFSLMRVWPDEPIRWAVPVFVAWLAPPTLLIWLTLMPMGHYLETWFFHALFLPPLVLVLSDRAGPISLGAFGAAAGVACAYVFSNVLFPVALGLLYLLFSTRSRLQRAGGLLVLGATTAGVWLLLAWDRIWAIGFRMTVAELPHHSEGNPLIYGLGDALERTRQNTLGMVGSETVVDGTSWARRGVFAVLKPAEGSLDNIVAYAVLIASAAGFLYLLRSTVVLLHPGRRERLDLPGRFLAAQGLLLAVILLANLAFRTDSVLHARVNYISIAYPPLLLGLALAAAALVQRSSGRVRRWTALPAICLGLVLAVGWGQASLWNLRALDRPDVPRMDHVMLSRLAYGMQPSAPIKSAAAELQPVCLSVHPQNEAFCAVNAWDSALHYFEAWKNDDPADPVCMGLVESERLACGVAAGMFINDPLVQEDAPPEGAPVEDLAQRCAVRAPEAAWACVSGAYKAGIVDPYLTRSWPVVRLMELCVGAEGGAIAWHQRACVEAVALMAKGTPPLPAAVADPQGPCAYWPADWTGLCAGFGSATQAKPTEVSCEEVYRSQYAEEIPTRNSLVYQQCLHFDMLAPGRGMYPACAIGAAKALEGLSCNWSGAELRL